MNKKKTKKQTKKTNIKQKHFGINFLSLISIFVIIYFVFCAAIQEIHYLRPTQASVILPTKKHLFIQNKIQSVNPKINNKRISTIIIQESKKHGYDPLFVASIIFFESKFNHNIVSKSGAHGLMQVLPSTAKYLTNQKFSSLELKDARTNVDLGLCYFKYLESKFKNKYTTLVAYNWGPGNVIKFRQIKEKNLSIPNITQLYATGILQTYKSWSKEFVSYNG